MRKITNTLMKYLDARQHIWNAYFLERFEDLRQCEPLASFEEIDRLLFFSLVCQLLKLGVPEKFSPYSLPIRQIIIKPKEIGREITMNINRKSTDNNMYWEERSSFEAKSLELSFIEFFQWDSYGFQSCSAVRGEIVTFPSRMQDVGKQALVDLASVDFFRASLSSLRYNTNRATAG